MNTKLTEQELTLSPLYELVLDTIVRPGGFTAMFKTYYNNYANIERWG